MATFTKPKNLNGTELREELRATGIEIGDLYSAVSISETGELILDIKESDIAKATPIVAATFTCSTSNRQHYSFSTDSAIILLKN